MNKISIAAFVLLHLNACAATDVVEPTTGGDKAAQATEYVGGSTDLLRMREFAEQGNAQAQCDLGTYYAQGAGVAQGDQEGLKWYRLSAKQNYAPAQYALGHAYAYGTGVEQDYIEAVQWYTLSAEQGHTASQHNLAGMYFRGNGVPQSYSNAIKWFRLAAQNRNAASLRNLGLMYENGLGIDQDIGQAAKWYWLSAEQGDPVALNQLGLMYAKGEYLPKNYVTAAMYFFVAIANGSEKAIQNRNRVSSLVSGEDYSRAQQMAADWLAEHSDRSSNRGGDYLGTRPDKSEQSTDLAPVVSAFGISLGMTPFEVRLRNGDARLVFPAPIPDGSTEHRERWVYKLGGSMSEAIEIIFSGDDPESMMVAIICSTGNQNELVGIRQDDHESLVMESLGYPDRIYWYEDHEYKHLYFTRLGVSFEARNGRISQLCIFDNKGISFRR